MKMNVVGLFSVWSSLQGFFVARNRRRPLGAITPVALFLGLALAWTAPAGAECQPDGGPNSCQAGSSRCLDNKRFQVCNPDTCVWDKIIPCPSSGSCVNGFCKEESAETKAPASAPKDSNLPKPRKPAHSCHDGEGFYNERTLYYNPGQGF